MSMACPHPTAGHADEISADAATAALKEIKTYITYYNLQRKHSASGYLTPAQFEANLSRPK